MIRIWHIMLLTLNSEIGHEETSPPSFFYHVSAVFPLFDCIKDV